MSIAVMGRQIQDGLIFVYDTFNTKSYRGQPTTNYVTYPLANWNGSGFALSYNYANNGVSYTFDTSVLTPLGDFSGVMRYYTGNTDYKYWSILMTGLSSGTYAFSYYAKASVAGGINNSQLWRDSGTDRSISGDWNPSYTTEWKRYVTVGPISVGNYLDYFPIHSGALTGGVYVYFWGFQLEKLSYASQFVVGTRSNTNALIDLTGNSVLDLTNAGFNTSANMTFDGSSNYIIAPENSVFNTQTPTVEVWIKTNATTQNGFWFEKGNVNTQYSLFQEGAVIQWRQNIGGVTNLSTTTANYISTSKWAHVVGTYTSGTRRLYINGVLVNSDTQSGTINTNTNGISMGVYGGYNGGRGYYYNGSIGMVRVYNRALNGDEIRKNYDATKSRYDL